MQNDRTKEQLMSGLHSLRQQVADLKASETKRQKGEDWFKGVLDSIQEAIIVVDNNGKIRSANLQTEKLFQHKREELYDQTVEILLPERLRRKHHDHRATYALNPKARPMGMDMNFVGLRKDGSEFPADISLSPMRTDEGVLFIAAIQDVTERKHADDQLREHALQLRESEERFRTIFEKASAGIALMAIEGTFLTVNERFCDIVGYNEGELLKLHWQDITYPRDLETGEDKVRQALTGEIQFFSFEKGYVKKDGSLVWVHLTASLLRSQTGEPKYFISIIDDITHRKQSHEKIREQAELLEVAQETIIVRDLENRVLYWNRSAENKYGWSKQEAIGRKLSDLLFRHDQSQLQDATKALFRDGKWEGELRPLSKQDKELIVESRWTLVRDEHGDPKAVLAVCTDVTEKKKIEDQFLRVQRMETIGTLAAGIAHDLNNILSPVLMGVEILKTNVSDASSQRVIATMESSVSRGSEVIKQLLLFGKGVETKRTIVQSATVIRETENILRESFPKNIRVEVKLSDRLGAISADMTQISQVLMNLCVNARDAMPNGGTLAVSAENILLDEHYARMNVEAKAGPYVLIQVVDSGAGIPKEALDKDIRTLLYNQTDR